MIAAKEEDGSWYVTRFNDKRFRNKSVFLIKAVPSRFNDKEYFSGCLSNVRRIIFPKAFIGRRIKLKVEFADHDSKQINHKKNIRGNQNE
jgi:hypothetical protein